MANEQLGFVWLALGMCLCACRCVRARARASPCVAVPLRLSPSGVEVCVCVTCVRACVCVCSCLSACLRAYPCDVCLWLSLSLCLCGQLGGRASRWPAGGWMGRSSLQGYALCAMCRLRQRRRLAYSSNYSAALCQLDTRPFRWR